MAGEPNDGIEAATPLSWGIPVSAHIQPVGDVDYYAIELSRQGEVTMTFDETPPELDMAFRIVDENGGQVWPWQTAEKPGALHSAWADVKSPGRYLIEVRDGYNNARSASPYRMTATIVETADPAEPNDGIEAATPLSWGIPVNAHILPVGDVDHYRLAVSAATELRVRFASVPEALDMAFRILDGSGREVHGWRTAPSPGAPFEAIVRLDAAGTYILEVRDGYNNARSAEPYSLIVSTQ